MDVSTGAASRKGVCLYSEGKHRRESKLEIMRGKKVADGREK